jgi:hypothetical protein
VIPVSAPYWPVLTGDLILGSSCHNLTMHGASVLTVAGNLSISPANTFTCLANSTIRIEGDLIVSGTLNPGTASVEFYGKYK